MHDFFYILAFRGDSANSAYYYATEDITENVCRNDLKRFKASSKNVNFLTLGATQVFIIKTPTLVYLAYIELQRKLYFPQPLVTGKKV